MLLSQFKQTCLQTSLFDFSRLSRLLRVFVETREQRAFAHISIFKICSIRLVRRWHTGFGAASRPRAAVGRKAAHCDSTRTPPVTRTPLLSIFVFDCLFLLFCYSFFSFLFCFCCCCVFIFLFSTIFNYSLWSTLGTSFLAIFWTSSVRPRC